MHSRKNIEFFHEIHFEAYEKRFIMYLNSRYTWQDIIKHFRILDRTALWKLRLLPDRMIYVTDLLWTQTQSHVVEITKREGP